MSRPNIKDFEGFSYGDMVSIGPNKYLFISFIKSIENKTTAQQGVINLIHLWTYAQITFTILAKPNGDLVSYPAPFLTIISKASS